MAANDVGRLNCAVDSDRCDGCPLDRICAWACEQGWSEPEIAVYLQLFANDMLLNTDDTVQRAVWESFL